ncbi:transcriptional regulator, LacI family [Novosphingobium sp. CF614]|uniref:LacI family DNA-binding transcriptional regulator n=1 Tax=Novosphingobium sp. CF614 TaxID=1884364 RepID=UPI0008F140D4|nr:LacI family DNA-binding transcriptional regulator [Novosphingobium sp. CF614]SFG26769.1 transcriptional regulator, LacI family [Novosphingobium sp. CF614]
MSSIIDVARRAAVSTATVSRVLSKPALVKAATRDRVLKVIEELKYEPNRAARTLRTSRASKILVTVPDISNPFFANIIRGAEEAARHAGYSVILGDTRYDPELESQYALMLLRREVDGLVFLGHRVPDILSDMISEQGSNAAVVNGCEYSPGLPVSSVHIDNAGAAAEMIDYLASLGHSSIGIITGPLASPISSDRLKGVRSAAKRHGIQASLQIGKGDYSVGSGFTEAQKLIRNHAVTAIFCFSDEMAIGASEAVAAAGLSCPQDISVAGFDDIRFARFLRPSLTTIAQPTVEIGLQAVHLLLEIMNDGQESLRNITLPHDLIVRKSTAARKA